MEDWSLPGGAVVGGGADKLRLRPPADWTRVILRFSRVPPSMNNNAIRSSWTGFHAEKKSWQADIGLLLMVEKVQRGRYERAMAGAILHFPQLQRRDTGNYSNLINKALGDALVIAPDMPVHQRYIPDDDEPHYYFSGVEFAEQRGPVLTEIHLFLQPKET